MYFLISGKYFPFQRATAYFVKCDNIQYSNVQFDGMRISLSIFAYSTSISFSVNISTSKTTKAF